MRYTTEIGSGATIFVPTFVKTDSAIQKLTGEYKDRQHCDHISLLLFFQDKQNRLKMSNLILSSYAKWTDTPAKELKVWLLHLSRKLIFYTS
jgi:hypothetical protein